MHSRGATTNEQPLPSVMTRTVAESLNARRCGPSDPFKGFPPRAQPPGALIRAPGPLDAGFDTPQPPPRIGGRQRPRVRQTGPWAGGRSLVHHCVRACRGGLGRCKAWGHLFRTPTQAPDAHTEPSGIDCGRCARQPRHVGWLLAEDAQPQGSESSRHSPSYVSRTRRRP